MKLHLKTGLMALNGLCLLMLFSMGMQPIWDVQRGKGWKATPEPNCGSIPVRSLTLVPESLKKPGGCTAPSHIELNYEPALMDIIEELPQATIEPGEFLEWETPDGMQFVDKDGFGRDLHYLTHDDFVYLDRIRLAMSPWNKSVIGLLANEVPPDRKIFLYWHIESDVLAPMPGINP